MLNEKFENVNMFQETLKYMLDRDLTSLIKKKYIIGMLKAKRQRMLQSTKEIHQEIDKNTKAADSYMKEKFGIELQFKNYIQNMNDAATDMLRDFEESVKVKEICRIMNGRQFLFLSIFPLLI